MSNWNKRKIDKESLSVDENFTNGRYDGNKNRNENHRYKFPYTKNIVR